MIKLFASFILILAVTTISVPAQKKHTPRPTGIFYQITGKNLARPSYLFGTIHVVCTPDMLPLEKVQAEIASAEQVVMELDMDDPDFTASMGRDLAMPGGKTLTDLLTTSQYQKVDEAFKSVFGVSVDSVKMVKPAYLGVMLATSPKAVGCNTPSSYDVAFAKMAVDKAKPIFGLETALFQVKALDYKPYDQQALDLYKMALNPQKTFDELKALNVAYKSQDAEKLYSLAVRYAGDKEFQTRLITDRNKDWASKIEEMITAKSTFVAVGGAHLGGPKGLLVLLRALGYKLTPVWL